MVSNEELAAALESRLRLDSAPVAVKMVPAGQEPPAGLLQRTKLLTFCQFVSASAFGGYPFWVSRRNLSCSNALVAFGMYDPERDTAVMEKAVRTHVGSYAPNAEAAKKLIASKPAILPGGVEGVAVAPLAKAGFDPDAVLAIVVPWQAYFAMDDYMYATGDAPLSLEVGTNSLVCAYGAVQAGHLGKIGLTSACTGGRNYAGFERSQMCLAFPSSKLEAWLEGMRERSRRVPYPGMIAMPAPTPMPPKHILMPDE
ncbi:MAG: DUF169 domain-containing protein [Chloroflexota bacterium]